MHTIWAECAHAGQGVWVASQVWGSSPCWVAYWCKVWIETSRRTVELGVPLELNDVLAAFREPDDE